MNPEEEEKPTEPETRPAQREAGERVLIVPPEAAGWRLDRFLTEAFRRHSRRRIARVLKAGEVRLGRRPLPPGFVLRGGERISIPPLDEAVARVEAARGPVREGAPAPRPGSGQAGRAFRQPGVPVLWRDADVLVVNKPPGVPVHGGAGLGATRTLLELLTPDVVLGFNIVHRLDRETSGAAVLVRGADLRAKMSAAFAEEEGKTVEKAYDALVEGVPEADSGTVDLPLADPGYGTRGRVDSRRGKSARTDWTVVERFQGAARLKVTPRTGRTHQIRLHLQAIGHPLLVDDLYGRRRGWRLVDAKGGPAARLSRTPLHASDVSFPHPRTGEIVHVHAPLWPDMHRAYEVLRVAKTRHRPPAPESEDQRGEPKSPVK